MIPAQMELAAARQQRPQPPPPLMNGRSSTSVSSASSSWTMFTVLKAFLAVALLMGTGTALLGQSVALRLTRSAGSAATENQVVISMVLPDLPVSANTTTSSSATTTPEIERHLAWLRADRAWSFLLQEGRTLLAANHPTSSSPGMVMEVGMYHARQCIEAAQAGFQAHCFEPSPKSFERIVASVNEIKNASVKERIHLYNQAAGSTSEGTLPFKVMNAAGTGDHVGSHNMWTMEKEEPTKAADQGPDSPFGDIGKLVQVQQIKLDDVVAKVGQDVFVLKVDTQGFEPAVFSGLQESIRTHKIKYALFEYWPKGMDLLADKMGQCVAVDTVLKPFAQAGYKLYQLEALGLSPYAPKGWRSLLPTRPFDTLMNNCQWFYHVEKMYPSETYKMGYWSDFLVVAPDAPVPDQPASNLGKVMQEERQRQRERDSLPKTN